MDWGSVGAIVALCLAGIIGLYLLGACGAAPLLSSRRKNAIGVQADGKKKVFTGATIPGRPAHVIAADAKKYADAKAALHKSTNGKASSSDAETTISKNVKTPGRPDCGDVSTVIPSMASVKVEEPVHTPSARESTYHASEAAHAALDAAGGESEATGETGLLKVALSAMSEDGADGAVSVKLEFTAPLAAKAESAALNPTTRVPSVQEIAVDSKPADSTTDDNEAAAPAAVCIENAVQGLSLPASPGGGMVTVKASEGAPQSIDVAGAVSAALSAGSGTVAKQQEVLSNPLFHNGTEPASVSQEK